MALTRSEENSVPWDLDSFNHKPVIKTFRLDFELTRILSKTSRKMGMSESAYVSKVLSSCLRTEPLNQNIELMRLSSILLQRILANIDPNRFEILASEVAKEIVPFAFDLLNLHPTTSSLNYYMYEILQDWGWFKMETTKVNLGYEIKLLHHYGPKWSLFLKYYLSSAYQSILMREPPNIITTDRVVKIHMFRSDSMEQEEE